MASIYNYYLYNPTLTDAPPTTFVEDNANFIKIKYENYKGYNVPIDAKVVIGINKKGGNLYKQASAQYSTLIYKCIQATIVLPNQNTKADKADPIKYLVDGLELTTIGSKIEFKDQPTEYDFMQNFKTNLSNLFLMVKQEASEPYASYFLNNVLFAPHSNRNCIMDYLFSLQHDLGSFYDTLIYLMIPCCNASGHCSTKKTMSFLACNNNLISRDVLKKILRKEMQAVRNNLTLINTTHAKIKTYRMVERYNNMKEKKKNKIYFDFIAELDTNDGNTHAIETVNTMSEKDSLTPKMNKPKIPAQLVLKKAKETVYTILGFRYCVENSNIDNDLKRELSEFDLRNIEEDAKDESSSEEEFPHNGSKEDADRDEDVAKDESSSEEEFTDNGSKEGADSDEDDEYDSDGSEEEFTDNGSKEDADSDEDDEYDNHGEDIFDESLESQNSQEIFKELPDELPDEFQQRNRAPSLELLPVQLPQQVQELRKHMNTFKIQDMSDLTVVETVNPIIKSINLESDNDHILCKIIFEKGLYTYTTIVDNFKKRSKYVSILKEAWWELTNDITDFNNYQPSNEENRWKYNGYGERPQVECYSMQRFQMPVGEDLKSVQYIINDHEVDVKNKPCLYLDLVYPDKKKKCKAFVTPILVSHRYYLNNIHQLDVAKGLVWLGSTSGMSAFYCYKNAFENAGFKFNGEYKTSLYNGITFPIAYVDQTRTYFKLQTNDSTDRIFLTKNQANTVIKSEESKMIAFIRGAEEKTEYEPTASDKEFKYRISFVNKMLDLMEKTDLMLFNKFMEEFKTKDGIKIDKNRVKNGTIKLIQNAIDGIVNDCLVKIKQSIDNPTDIPNTETTRWVWNAEGARKDIFIKDSYDKLGLFEWIMEDRGDYDTVDQVNYIFEKMNQDKPLFFKEFKDMFNNAYFKSYRINDRNRLCNKSNDSDTSRYKKAKLDDQYNALWRGKRNFPMKYSVHMAFEKTDINYDIVYSS